jgi:hypothetical protein
MLVAVVTARAWQAPRGMPTVQAVSAQARSPSPVGGRAARPSAAAHHRGAPATDCRGQPERVGLARPPAERAWRQRPDQAAQHAQLGRAGVFPAASEGKVSPRTFPTLASPPVRLPPWNGVCAAAYRLGKTCPGGRCHEDGGGHDDVGVVFVVEGCLFSVCLVVRKVREGGGQDYSANFSFTPQDSPSSAALRDVTLAA